jgi:hypothetical protein
LVAGCKISNLLSMAHRERIFNCDQRFYVLLHRGRKVSIDVIRASYLDRLKLNPKYRGRVLRLFEDECGIWVGRIPKDAHAGNPWKNLLEQFQSFRPQIWRHQTHASDVSVRSRQTGNKATSQRIARVRHYDWNSRGGPFGG